MKLDVYLASDGGKQTDEEFAVKIGVSRSMVTRLRNGQARPSASVALRIENATGRQVTLADLLVENGEGSGGAILAAGLEAGADA